VFVSFFSLSPQDAYNNLKKILANKWEFVMMQADEQVGLSLFYTPLTSSIKVKILGAVFTTIYCHLVFQQ
jgi:Regulator of G-protein signalling DHEX domain